MSSPVSNPNRRQSLQSLPPLAPFKATPGNFLVTPSTLELDDDIPQSGFTPSVPRRPQQQPQVRVVLFFNQTVLNPVGSGG